MIHCLSPSPSGRPPTAPHAVVTSPSSFCVSVWWRSLWRGVEGEGEGEGGLPVQRAVVGVWVWLWDAAARGAGSLL